MSAQSIPLNSVLGEVNEDGEIVDANDNPVPLKRYDAYGAELTNIAGTTDHKFVGSLGHTTDSNTGLVYMRARYYDPTLGRFISEDPAGDGVNWYAYCANNPINCTDSTGKFLDLLLGALIGLERDGSEGAAASAVKKYGVDKIYQAVAYHSGYISGYLLAGEITHNLPPNGKGITIRNASKKRQIFIDFAGDHWGGRHHIDFQPDYVGGKKYEKIFIDGLLDGLMGK